MFGCLRIKLGLFRLKFGFCPLCDSSPPLAKCYVCRGSLVYGHLLDDETKAEWRQRFLTISKEK